MSKGFQLATLAGALTMVMSTNALAVGLPAGGDKFVGWSVAAGEINETTGGICASALYDCSVVASGKGFKQLNVTEVADASSGTSYIMTIVTDQNADGSAGANLGFSDVSFVKMKLTLGDTIGDGESGITAHQEINEGGGSFISTSDINTGWAAAEGDVNIAISQELTDDASVNFAGDNFESGFLYRSKNAADGTRTGFEMSIDQVAGLGTNATSVDKSDIQAFALREKQGSMLMTTKLAADQIDLDGNGTGITWEPYAATTDPTTGVVTETNADDIKAIWIGQQINLGSGDLNGSLGSSFGYLSFDNVADPAQAVESGFGFSATNSSEAWVWDTAFDMAGKDDLAPALTRPVLPVLVP